MLHYHYMFIYVEQLMVNDASSDEKVLRSRHHVITPSVLSMTLPRKRRQLTPEELDQRRKKVATYVYYTRICT